MQTLTRRVLPIALLSLLTATAAHAGDDRTSCAVTLKNGYYEEDANDHGYTQFWVYDGDDTILSTARKTKNVAYGTNWETYCEVNGQDYCKVRYANEARFLGVEWALNTVNVACDGTYEATDSGSN